MRSIKISVILAVIFILAGSLYAQGVKIVDVKGKVYLRPQESLSWRQARVGDYLRPQYQLRTQQNSECTLSFDGDLNKVITIKGPSQVNIKDVLPADIKLTQGRVFSLIRGLKKSESFTIRTPTAVAGVRGTGWFTGFGEGGSTFKCFEGTVHIQGTDEEGNVVSETDLDEGFGVNVGFGGNIGEGFELGDEDFRDWQGFQGNLKGLKPEEGSEGELGEGLEGSEGNEGFQEERAGEQHDRTYEESRRQKEEEENRGQGRGKLVVGGE